MSLEFLWFLPAGGDGRYGAAGPRRRGERDAGQPAPFGPGVSDPRGERFNYFDHLHQIARAAELSGFDGVQIEHDPDNGDESWIIAGSLARGTRRLKLVTEFEASWGSAVYAAKNAATFQRYTGGRFHWFVRTGGDAVTRARGGDTIPAADVLPRIAELLDVARGVLTQAPFTFKGRFFEVLDGGFRDGLDHQPVPTIYLAGDGPEALALSASHADVHVFSPTSPVQLRAAIAGLDQLAANHRRRVRHGVRLDLLARETSAESERDARWLPAGARLAGSYAAVIEQLEAYREAGIDTFLLGATPHLEEAYRIGAHVLPHFRADRRSPASPNASAVGATP